jgi:peptide/nickel transport system permease protein
MISDARTHFRSAPHTILAPGLCIVALTLGINLLGDVLRDVFDVRSEDIRAL